jgi:hypothetical protein
MWKIFYNKNIDKLETRELVNSWKRYVFSKLDIKVKKYFAEKVVVDFDNKMIFQQKKGMHENLMESLAFAENNIKDYLLIFKEVRAYLIEEDNGDNFLIVSNLPNDESYYPSIENKFEFKLIEDDAIPLNGKFEKMEYLSWGTLVFNVSLSDFYRGWINFTPSLEKRTELQTKFILSNVNYKKNELSLTEKIEFEKTITENSQYDELYQKILKIMPKIESSLEQEWRVKVVSQTSDKKKIKK